MKAVKDEREEGSDVVVGGRESVGEADAMPLVEPPPFPPPPPASSPPRDEKVREGDGEAVEEAKVVIVGEWDALEDELEAGERDTASARVREGVMEDVTVEHGELAGEREAVWVA